MNLFRIDLALFALWPLAELLLARVRTARGRATEGRDRGSFGLLWVTFPVAIVLGFMLQDVSATRLPFAPALGAAITFGLLIAGLSLRIAAIVVLGRFFTVNVAVHEDHQVVRAGPYRYIRHPSYTGALIAFLGVALLPGNALSLLVIMVPITLVFLYRIRVEEAGLRDGLGGAYVEYCRHTRRLIPGIY